MVSLNEMVRKVPDQKGANNHSERPPKAPLKLIEEVSHAGEGITRDSLPSIGKGWAFS